MVTRGFVNYSGAPLNYAIDFDDALLKSLEVGSYPYFIWTYEDSSMLKDSSFQYLLSTGYETWYDYVVELYTEVSEILLPLQGQTIVEHNQVIENVFATIYEDGTKVIVNYNREPVEVDGYMIDQKGYLVMEGE